MPYSLDKLDIAIVNSLQEDGRKSFRQISRELKISTPTIKSRYQRLVNIGLIKSISPIIDTNKLDYDSKLKIEKRHCETKVPNVNLSTDVSVKMICDYCDGPIGVKPSIFKFANIERFFCCTSCKSLYKEKYKGRIEAIIRKS
ncbi:MAG: AsnC family transcriptional regulator [Marine Group I thaumarchaeote]|nr:MAG: AsnC family transcriptional regulator [Marine Group I thaumarchaeote]